MSFRDMIGAGGECSANGNSLAKLSNHLQAPSSSSFRAPPSLINAEEYLQNPLNRPPREGVFDPAEFTRDFLGSSRPGAPRLAGPREPFQLDAVHRELERTLDRERPVEPSASGWASEFNRFKGKHVPAASQFDPHFETAFQQAALASSSIQVRESQSGPIVDDAAQRAFDQVFEQVSQQHAVDWTQEFQAAHSTAALLQNESSVAWADEFAAHTSQPFAGSADEQQLNESFEKVWQNIKDQMPLRGDGLGTDFVDPSWEDEFLGNNSTWPVQDFNDVKSIPYQFESDNPFLNHPDPFSEALRLYNEGGNLSDAVLALEAVVQKQIDHSEAWMLLGQIQAETEREIPAIAALQKCLEIDPSNADALLALAVNYTNEGMNNESYLTLERWVQTAYPTLASWRESRLSPFFSENDVRQHVMTLYLEAAQKGPSAGMQRDGKTSTNGQIDADVQVGLGVLCYNLGEFDKAIDCFTSALSVQPDNYRLWNRLGATLANSGKSEQAIEAYHRALQIKPTFVRAHYNLGISCINIGCYKEAAEHLLGVLHMQHSGVLQGRHADDWGGQSVWETLRRVFTLMHREDLVQKAFDQPDLALFRGEFEF
ncbi:uncharacterized protein BJ171DRAFT_210654 [Polychytrium aggregatum]|uniref:uncharacterized protein n=1 Tax=Polychytrium aggregatum TaxID=110093 RepID=UPI0022FEB66C|nr:uncharacterized protein BJ171DRAFT_210654 [Polychytrium aggregatum]KAI9208581.1 hypothetical protein BJ171DRAFT_210654 [Polychytrium aggregatum]